MDRHGRPAKAPGNLAGFCAPAQHRRQPLARLTRAGYLGDQALLGELGPTVLAGPAASLHLARDLAHEAVQPHAVDTWRPGGISPVHRPGSRVKPVSPGR